MTITLYRGPEVLITSQKFERRSPSPQCYWIDELENVHVLEERPRIGRLLIGPVIGLLIVVLAAASATDHMYLIAIAATGTSTVITGTCVRLTPTAHELRATYRSHDVRLFATRNSETFGQVRRGLWRALERRVQLEEQYRQVTLPDSPR